MRVLVVHAHPSPTSYSRALSDAAEGALRGADHDVTVVHLDEEAFRPAMTPAEHAAYHTASPILDADVARYATVLKGWLERVLVPGVAFHLDLKTNKVKADLRQVRRLVGITTYGSSHWQVRLLADPGRRMLMRALRMLCARRCRRTWLGLYGMDTSTDDERATFLDRVVEHMSRL